MLSGAAMGIAISWSPARPEKTAPAVGWFWYLGTLVPVIGLAQVGQQALADRYTIERELGRGGAAAVFLAEDLRHHRKVALKILRPDVAEAVGSERFLREIEVAANFTHPHILPLHDSGDADGLLYYVMPFVTGGSLRDRLGV